MGWRGGSGSSSSGGLECGVGFWFVRCLAALGWRLEGEDGGKYRMRADKMLALGAPKVPARCTVYECLIDGCDVELTDDYCGLRGGALLGIQSPSCIRYIR